MFNGNNVSGLEFETVDEDGELLGAFAELPEALACARAAPWWMGACRIRRDIGTQLRRHQFLMAEAARRRREFAIAFECDY